MAQGPQATPLSTYHCDLLSANYGVLLDCINPGELTPHLVQNRVLTIPEADRVRDEKGFRDKNACIISDLYGKPDALFPRFIQSLRQSNHDHVANVLETPLDTNFDIPACIKPAPPHVTTGTDMACANICDKGYVDVRVSVEVSSKERRFSAVRLNRNSKKASIMPDTTTADRVNTSIVQRHETKDDANGYLSFYLEPQDSSVLANKTKNIHQTGLENFPQKTMEIGDQAIVSGLRVCQLADKSTQPYAPDHLYEIVDMDEHNEPIDIDLPIKHCCPVYPNCECPKTMEAQMMVTFQLANKRLQMALQNGTKEDITYFEGLMDKCSVWLNSWKTRGIDNNNVQEGSVILSFTCTSPEALNTLWRSWITGQLKSDLEEMFLPLFESQYPHANVSIVTQMCSHQYLRYWKQLVTEKRLQTLTTLPREECKFPEIDFVIPHLRRTEQEFCPDSLELHGNTHGMEEHCTLEPPEEFSEAYESNEISGNSGGDPQGSVTKRGENVPGIPVETEEKEETAPCNAEIEEGHPIETCNSGLDLQQGDNKFNEHVFCCEPQPPAISYRLEYKTPDTKVRGYANSASQNIFRHVNYPPAKTASETCLPHGFDPTSQGYVNHGTPYSCRSSYSEISCEDYANFPPCNENTGQLEGQLKMSHSQTSSSPPQVPPRIPSVKARNHFPDQLTYATVPPQVPSETYNSKEDRPELPPRIQQDDKTNVRMSDSCELSQASEDVYRQYICSSACKDQILYEPLTYDDVLIPETKHVPPIDDSSAKNRYTTLPMYPNLTTELKILGLATDKGAHRNRISVSSSLGSADYYGKIGLKETTSAEYGDPSICVKEGLGSTSKPDSTENIETTARKVSKFQAFKLIFSGKQRTEANTSPKTTTLIKWLPRFHKRPVQDPGSGPNTDDNPSPNTYEELSDLYPGNVLSSMATPSVYYSQGDLAATEDIYSTKPTQYLSLPEITERTTAHQWAPTDDFGVVETPKQRTHPPRGTVIDPHYIIFASTEKPSVYSKIRSRIQNSRLRGKTSSSRRKFGKQVHKHMLGEDDGFVVLKSYRSLSTETL